MWKRLLAVFVARNKEFFRDWSALSWSLFFPAILVLGFAFAFSDKTSEYFQVAVLGAADDSAFFQTQRIDWLPVKTLETALQKLKRHQYDLVIAPQQRQYWVNEASTRGYFLAQLLNNSPYQRQPVTGKTLRYVDWVIPGIVTMNIMFSALFGVGFIIIRYRKMGVLKRLKATPLSAFEFLAAQVMSRMWVLMATTLIVFAEIALFVDFTMEGRYVELFVFVAFGCLSMISLGLVFAARISNEELASGVLNLVTWPMMLLSGVWFSTDHLHPLLQKFAYVLPLTHITEGARAIMLEGAGLVDLGVNIAYLLISSLVFLGLGAYWFLWESK